MRNVVVLLIAFMASACASYPKFESFESNVNFQRHSDNGFFITVGEYPEVYMPIGLVSLSCYDGMFTSVASTDNAYLNDDVYYSSRKAYKKELKVCEVNELIDQLVEQARGQGADGIIKLKIINKSRPFKKGKRQEGMIVTGFAIRRTN